MSKFSKIVLVGFVIFFVSLFFVFFSYLNFVKTTTISYKKFIVNKGDTIYKISEKLCKDNIISNCLFLKYYIKSNKFSSIKPGNYSFSGESLSGFFHQLEKGPKIKYVKFTILPGWTKYDIAEKLKNKIDKIFLELVDDQVFIENLKEEYSILNEFGNIKSLEGFIYPDTYFFKKSDLKSFLFPQLLIKTAIKNFSKKWRKLELKCKQNKRCNPYKLPKYEILILASIVEKEERNLKNKPYVADILIRRYKNNWFIGADWTLCYGLEINSKDCKNYLYNKYLKDKSNKYNTRAIKGLPPTPVGNPTMDSIKAILYPEKNNYWYYLHDKNGQIHFGKTANEHFLNKQRYLK